MVIVVDLFYFLYCVNLLTYFFSLSFFSPLLFIFLFIFSLSFFSFFLSIRFFPLTSHFPTWLMGSEISTAGSIIIGFVPGVSMITDACNSSDSQRSVIAIDANPITKITDKKNGSILPSLWRLALNGYRPDVNDKIYAHSVDDILSEMAENCKRERRYYWLEFWCVF